MSSVFVIRPCEDGGVGLGVFATRPVPAGAPVVSERAAVLGPKTGAAEAACVGCCLVLKRYFREDPARLRCRDCGLPLCQGCLDRRELLEHHASECRLFKSLGKKFDLKGGKEARRVNYFLAPLRLLLLKADEGDELGPWSLRSHLDLRADTLVHCLTEANVVRAVRTMLEEEDPDRIHRACGILDTNCYDLSLGGGAGGVAGRALYPRTIARINHSCEPNCRKTFSEGGAVMTVVAARDIAEGEEFTLSYTPTLMGTPLRQVLLQRTKHFVCTCPRCLDPTERGTHLSGLRCPNCRSVALPARPKDPDTQYTCQECSEKMAAEKAKLLTDSAMQLAAGCPDDCEEISRIIAGLTGKFLAPSHQIACELKLKFVDKVLNSKGSECSRRGDLAEAALGFCSDLLEVSEAVVPGQSRLRGLVSSYAHALLLRFPGCTRTKKHSELVLSPEEVREMFEGDESFTLDCNRSRSPGIL